ncbi:DUF4163 domain-containing protein [Erythrobacter sp. JK5]|uniref:DUF4163 domain-containing protein n=1 Tax=Erythrobacter sp. JK5 TaxID=2829500 RepID=UPI001BA88C05|nr:DUF4163 domain-containing protein [Erythrobacter sp. JK5]QUL36567.1 DUF4163 domain-containing protein [Erythrobacter sp. JK5]
MKIATSLAAVALIACSSPQDMGEAVGTDASDGAGPASETGQPREIMIETDSLKFVYAWPAQVLAIPALDAAFEVRAQGEHDEYAAYAAEAKADAEKNDYPFRGYDFSKGWEVAADTPRFLSLVAGTYAYTGGAHGNSWFDAMLWDRRAEAELAPTDLFASPAALEGAVREAYCNGLKSERSERLGGSRTNGPDIFDSCPALDELVMVLGSSDGETFDTIELLAAPYVAGAYAEGPYEVTVPVTQPVIDVAKPEYRAAFSLAN